MATNQEIQEAVKDFIMTEFLPGEDPNELTDETPLVTGGILDSLATLRLVTFVEETYGVQLEPHEMTNEHLDTLVLIAMLIQSKL